MTAPGLGCLFLQISVAVYQPFRDQILVSLVIVESVTFLLIVRYLHSEVIVDNGDIGTARTIPGRNPSQYAVELKFYGSGTEKMRKASGNHIGKPVAIIIDGRVVVAPVVRSPIGDSALVTGHFTKAEAERIVHGIGLH